MMYYVDTIQVDRALGYAVVLVIVFIIKRHYSS
jgi:hypothetical protein